MFLAFLFMIRSLESPVIDVDVLCWPWTFSLWSGRFVISLQDFVCHCVLFNICCFCKVGYIWCQSGDDFQMAAEQGQADCVVVSVNNCFLQDFCVVFDVA